MTPLALHDVSLNYGDVSALTTLSLRVGSGEVHAVLGASGAGKTSTLRVIAGFERVSTGQVLIGDDVVDDGTQWVPPERRGVGVVFQDYALFPLLTVAKNIAFGMGGHTIMAVEEMLERVDLRGYGSRMPNELSGGEQQRVALARALGQKPSLLLLDEPFAHLDRGLRGSLRTATFEIVRASGVAAIMVTHDPSDALSVSDTLHVMSNGAILQSGDARTLYEAPHTRSVAETLGSVQTLPCIVREHSAACVLGDIPLAGSNRTGQTLLVRPESLRLHPASSGQGHPARVVRHAYRGGEVDATLLVEGGVSLEARIRPWELPESEHVRISVAGPCALLAD
jgi:iron(III) transport system ATP-binding protein